MKPFLFLFLVLFTINSCKPPALSLPNEVAEAYGFSKFDQVKSIAFTFHAQKGAKQVSRNWKWYPHDKRVEHHLPDGLVTYNQEANLSKEEKELDAKFINDSFWLLFPYYLNWNRDSYMTFVQKEAQSPIKNQKTKALTITFNDKDGYTPGDAYDLYLSEKNEILEWTYRKGGQKEATKSTTWEGIKDFSGVKLSTDHHTADGEFRLWFDKIEIEFID